MTDIIKFYGHHTYKPYHQFSNFYETTFNYTIPEYLNSDEYPSIIKCENSEKAIMISKAILMNDKEIFVKLMNTKNPAECKKLGRLIKNFNQKLWDKYIEDIAYDVLLQKFTSNLELTELLLNTNNKIIVESTENDKIWGNGININDPKSNEPKLWIGKNILGNTLMKVRFTLLNKT
jgi:ribA/ribD-fused uncharacterized protein